MKRAAATVVFLLMMCCLSSSRAQQAKEEGTSVQAMPLCAIVADASKYDSKQIVVRGLYRMVIHGSILMDRAHGRESAGGSGVQG